MSTQAICRRVARAIREHGTSERSAGGIWGSLARGEIAPLSDVDLFYYCPADHGAVSARLLAESVSSLTENHPVDVVLADSEDLIEAFALRNGINFHALYFARFLRGDYQMLSVVRDAQHAFLQLEASRARELLNVLASLIALQRLTDRNDPRRSKFGPTGSNRWVRLALAAQLRWPTLRGSSTQTILKHLLARYTLSQSTAVTQWLSTLEWRRLEEGGVSESRDIAASEPVEDGAWQLLAHRFLCDVTRWTQRVAGVAPELLTKFAEAVCGRTILASSPGVLDEPTQMLLEAFVTTEPGSLDQIARNAPDDWWIATTVAANLCAAPTTLKWLISVQCSRHGVLWKTVRLYVAKNPNSSPELLAEMIAQPYTRDQERDAALMNLASRRILQCPSNNPSGSV